MYRVWGHDIRMTSDTFCNDYGHDDRYVPASDGPAFYVCDRCGARGGLTELTEAASAAN